VANTEPSDSTVEPPPHESPPLEGPPPAAPPEPVAAPPEPVAAPPAAPPEPVQRTNRARSWVRILGILVIVAGVILIGAGIVTWFVVQDQLSDEQIVVAEDADRFAGEPVDGPLTAYAEADAIEKHALEASGGLTYAQLDREDPVRDTVMDASFLRASLFTSVVSFGVAAMAMGLGVLSILIGVALILVARQLPTATVVTAEPVPAIA
jgi:hypothetical protein